MRRSYIAKAALFFVLLICDWTPLTSNAAENASTSIHYVETPKPVEPLDLKKALGFAQAFFEKKYASNANNYFPAKMEYGFWTENSHPYSWEILYYPKPGHGIAIGGLFWVKLLVTPDGRVSVEKNVYATFK